MDAAQWPLLPPAVSSRYSPNSPKLRVGILADSLASFGSDHRAAPQVYPCAFSTLYMAYDVGDSLYFGYVDRRQQRWLSAQGVVAELAASPPLACHPKWYLQRFCRDNQLHLLISADILLCAGAWLDRTGCLLFDPTDRYRDDSTGRSLRFTSWLEVEQWLLRPNDDPVAEQS